MSETLQSELGKLLAAIRSLPSPQNAELIALAEKVKQRHAELKKSVSSLQNSFDYLRLVVKYIVFDLEATRRENAVFRKWLNKWFREK